MAILASQIDCVIMIMVSTMSQTSFSQIMLSFQRRLYDRLRIY